MKNKNNSPAIAYYYTKGIFSTETILKLSRFHSFKFCIYLAWKMKKHIVNEKKKWLVQILFPDEIFTDVAKIISVKLGFQVHIQCFVNAVRIL